MLQGQVQVEARLESKLETIGEIQRAQMMSVLKDQQAGGSGKGNDPSEHSTPYIACCSSSSNGGGLTRDRNEAGILSPIPKTRVPEHQNNAPGRTLKLEFPKFNDENPRLWLKKCFRYFAYNQMSDYDKLSLVAMNVDGMTDNWFVDYIEDKRNLTWEEFTHLGLERFFNPTGGSIVA